MKKISVALLCLVFLVLVGCKGEKEQRLADGSFEFNQSNYPRIAVTEYTKNAAINITSAVLDLNVEKAESLLLVCNTTDECYILLKNNECDMVIAHEYGKIAEAELKTSALQVEKTELWDDALVFFSNGNQKIDSLSVEQLTKIYNGEIKDWSEFGTLEDKKTMPVVLFSSPDGTASKAAFEKYIGADIEVEPIKRPIVTDKGKYEAIVSYDNRDGALGYSLLSQVGNLSGGSVKLLKVNSIEPTVENILSGAYGLRTAVSATIRVSEQATSPARILYNWIISEQGKLCY